MKDQRVRSAFQMLDPAGHLRSVPPGGQPPDTEHLAGQSLQPRCRKLD